MPRIDPTAAAGFGAAADVYERARPTYPPEAIAWLVERCGIGPDSIVADVGAGTGKLTRLLVPTGARVVAVEPVAAMRAQLETSVPGTDIRDGTAEALPFADGEVDVVTVGQAFHWFDHERALPELHRVLAPDGWLALAWNMRDLADELQAGIENLLAPVRTKVRSKLEGAWREPLEQTKLFGPVQRADFRHEQLLSADGIVERVASTSFVAALPVEERAELLARVRGLVARRTEPIAVPYVAEVDAIPRTSDRADGKGGTSNEG